MAVAGASLGGPYTITASTGADPATAATARVVPALTTLSVAGEITLGTEAVATLALESQAPVALDVTLSAGAQLGVPSVFRIPAGASSATIQVAGTALGGPVSLSAKLAGSSVTSTTRVSGLFLSEALLDVTSTDTQKEWIELYNATANPIEVSGFRIKVANSTAYLESLVLVGTIPAKGCVVVGGPLDSVGIQANQYFQAADFSVDLGNATGGAADGLSLTDGKGVVIDNVIYGNNNSSQVTDENASVPTAPDITMPGTNQSIERSGPANAAPWIVQPSPNPGTCSAIAS